MHQIVHSLVGKTQKCRREDENICLVPLRFQPLLCLRNLECDAEGSGHVFLEYTFFCKNRIYSACKCTKNIVQWQIFKKTFVTTLRFL